MSVCACVVVEGCKCVQGRGICWEAEVRLQGQAGHHLG